MIGILDYGVGNIQAIKNILIQAEIECCFVSNKHDSYANYSAIVLPGVGSFDYAMMKLNESGLRYILNNLKKNQSVIGICLGMQLLCEGSEEGTIEGLGFVPGKVKKLRQQDDLGIPNCGWRNLQILPGKDEEYLPARAYFNHSYALRLEDSKYATSLIENRSEIVASLRFENFFGFQFHPERSHKYGISLFKSLIKCIDI